MLAIIPVSSTSATWRGDLRASSQRSASSRSPLRISVQIGPSTCRVVHALSQVASANGLPPSLAQRFIKDRP
jgi:hypothetical protein